MRAEGAPSEHSVGWKMQREAVAVRETGFVTERR